MNRFILITFFIVSILTCNEKIMPIELKPEKPADSIFDLNWATMFHDEIISNDNTISYKDWVIIGGDSNKSPTFYAYNKDTGDKDWEFILDDFSTDEIDYANIIDQIYLARTSKRIIAIDLDSKQLLWQRKLPGFRLGQPSVGENGKYYLCADFGFKTDFQVKHLLEFDIETGEFESIFSIKSDSLGRKSFSPPAIFERSSNEYIILTYAPNVQEPVEKIKQNLICIDYITKEVLWDICVTDKFSGNGLYSPTIYNNELVIVGGDWSLYAFDIVTGQQVWSYSYDYPYGLWSNTKPLLVGTKLFVNNDVDDVSCFNVQTGNLIWNNPKGGANCTLNMNYIEKDDLLVFTSWGYGSIMVLDASIGSTLLREHRYDDSSYNNDIVYDKERDMYFTSTYKHVVGFKIRK